MSTVNPVDHEEMEGEQDNLETPTLAQQFLEQHRPAGIARGDIVDNDEGVGNDDGAEELREADGELEVDAPEINGGHNVVGDDESGVPAPPIPFLAPCPRAKGVNHPPVPTRAQIETHALEQHVNYKPWCPHCV